MQIPSDMMFEFSPSIVLLIDRAGVVHAANQAARARLRLPADTAQDLATRATPSGRAMIVRKLEGLDEKTPTASGRLQLQDGGSIGFSLRLLPNDTAMLVGRDLSEGVGSYERLASLFQGAQTPIVVWDADGVIHESNASLSSWTALSTSQLRGSSIDDLFDGPPPEPGKIVETYLRGPAGRIPVRADARQFEADEEQLTVSFITDRRGEQRQAELERSLAQAQRLEALGRMAAGIAHEFNNMLMAALPWADLIRRKYPEDETLVKAADHIRRAVHRARDITRQLLDFGQPRTAAPANIGLGSMLRQQHKLLSAASENVKIDVEIPSPDLVAYADPAQMAQALLNLGLFARDHSRPGTSILLRSSQSEAAFVSIHLTWSGLSLTDDQQSALFDPFAAAEDARSGGLALSVARRIVEQNSGRISVRSHGGESEIEVCVPASPAAPATASEQPSDELFAGLTVLLVDDNVGSISGLIPLLQEKGSSVHLVTSARDATLTAAAVPVNVAILDAGLPDSTPAALAAAIFESRPDSRIIFTSGGTADDLDLPADRRIAFLGKPFELDDLMRRLAAVASGTLDTTD